MMARLNPCPDCGDKVEYFVGERGVHLAHHRGSVCEKEFNVWVGSITGDAERLFVEQWNRHTGPRPTIDATDDGFAFAAPDDEPEHVCLAELRDEHGNRFQLLVFGDIIDTADKAARWSDDWHLDRVTRLSGDHRDAAGRVYLNEGVTVQLRQDDD